MFQSANSIRPGSPVRIAGVNVGKVKAVEAEEGTDDARRDDADRRRRAAAARDATAKIRPRIFLEGNFFVDLQPGTPGAPELDDGDTIKVTQTATPVQLDEVLTALQSDTRAGPAGRARRRSARRWTAEPTAAQDRSADPSARGETAAESFNDAYDDIGPAERAHAQVNEALLGTEPERDLGAADRAAPARTTAGLARNEVQLRDLVSNFNTTMAALAAERRRLRALDPRAAGRRSSTANARVRRAQRRVPAHARVRARDPARRARDGRRRSTPRSRGSRRRARCSPPAELQGLAARPRAGVRATSRG